MISVTWWDDGFWVISIPHYPLVSDTVDIIEEMVYEWDLFAEKLQENILKVFWYTYNRAYTKFIQNPIDLFNFFTGLILFYDKYWKYWVDFYENCFIFIFIYPKISLKEPITALYDSFLGDFSFKKNSCLSPEELCICNFRNSFGPKILNFSHSYVDFMLLCTLTIPNLILIKLRNTWSCSIDFFWETLFYISNIIFTQNFLPYKYLNDAFLRLESLFISLVKTDSKFLDYFFLNVFYLSFYNLLFTFFFTFFFWKFLIENNLKKKILYFFIFVINVSVWGFLYELEAFVFLLFLCELIIVLIFCFSFLTTQIKLRKTPEISPSYFVVLGLFIVIATNSSFPEIIVFADVYSSLHKICSDDFFIFFFFFFYDFWYLTYILAVFLSLFSFFFIFFFFFLKNLKDKKLLTNKNSYFLRKQKIIHQTNYKSSYRTFQK